MRRAPLVHLAPLALAALPLVAFSCWRTTSSLAGATVKDGAGDGAAPMGCFVSGGKECVTFEGSDSDKALEDLKAMCKGEWGQCSTVDRIGACHVDQASGGRIGTYYYAAHTTPLAELRARCDGRFVESQAGPAALTDDKPVPAPAPVEIAGDCRPMKGSARWALIVARDGGVLRTDWATAIGDTGTPPCAAVCGEGWELPTLDQAIEDETVLRASVDAEGGEDAGAPQPLQFWTATADGNDPALAFVYTDGIGADVDQKYGTVKDSFEAVICRKK